MWRHRGRQHKETFRTLAEAREAQGKRRAGDGTPSSKVTVDAYFTEWIETYSGRTSQGLSDRSRGLYRQAIEERVIPEWGTWRIGEVEPVESGASTESCVRPNCRPQSFASFAPRCRRCSRRRSRTASFV
jgi:hypothetical protein